MLINSDWPAAVRFQTDVEEAARAVGLPIQILSANSESEIDDAFNGLAQTQAGALLVGPGPFFDSRRDKLIALVAKARVSVARIIALPYSRWYSKLWDERPGGLSSGRHVHRPRSERREAGRPSCVAAY